VKKLLKNFRLLYYFISSIDVNSGQLKNKKSGGCGQDFSKKLKLFLNIF